jgi:hypothetical protein
MKDELEGVDKKVKGTIEEADEKMNDGLRRRGERRRATGG